MLVLDVTTPRVAGQGAAAVRKQRARRLTAYAAKKHRALIEFVKFALIAPMERHMERKAATHALMGFTDHYLGDIGLTRSDISIMAAGVTPSRGVAAMLDAPALPPQRSAYRPRRRETLVVNGALARRRTHGSVPTTGPFCSP